MSEKITPRRARKVLLSQLCAGLWPLLGGAGVLGGLGLVLFAVTGGHYGRLTLLFYGPVALGLVVAGALLRMGAKRPSPR